MLSVVCCLAYDVALVVKDAVHKKERVGPNLNFTVTQEEAWSWNHFIAHQQNKSTR